MQAIRRILDAADGVGVATSPTQCVGSAAARPVAGGPSISHDAVFVSRTLGLRRRASAPTPSAPRKHPSAARLVRLDVSAAALSLQDMTLATRELPLAEAMRCEHLAVIAQAERSRERAEALRELTERAELQAAGDEKLAQDMATALGLSAQTTLDDLDGRLRGERLREIAVQVLSSRHETGEPIHYRAWYELLRDEGYAVAGKDPLATFLAQISRAPEVTGIGRRSGLYRLRTA